MSRILLALGITFFLITSHGAPPTSSHPAVGSSSLRSERTQPSTEAASVRPHNLVIGDTNPHTSGRAAFIVGTFNLLNQTYTAGKAGREWQTDRRPTAAAQIIESGVSIVGLQESSSITNSTGQTQAQDLAAEINAQLAMPDRWKVVEIPAVEGPPIIYDSTVQRVVGAPNSAPLNHVNASGKTRTMLWALFEHIASRTPYILINGHWTPNNNGGSRKAALRRAETAQIVTDLATSLRKGTNLPIILTADYNSSPSARSPRRTLTAAGFPDSREIADTVINGKLNSWNSLDESMTGLQTGKWIDGIHVSAESIHVTAVTCYVSFADGDSLPLATPLPSDHNMVTAALEVASSPAWLEMAHTVGGGS